MSTDRNRVLQDENVLPFLKRGDRKDGNSGKTDKAKKKFKDTKDGVRIVFSDDDRMSPRSKQARVLLLERYLSHANPEAFDETGLLVAWFGLDGSAKTAKSPRKLPVTKRGLINIKQDLMALDYLELIAAGGFGRTHTDLVRVKIPGSKRETTEKIERCIQIATDNGWVPGKGERRGREKVNGAPKKGERYSPKDSTGNAPFGSSPTGGPASRKTAEAGASVQEEPPYGGFYENSEDPGHKIRDQYSAGPDFSDDYGHDCEDTDDASYYDPPPNRAPSIPQKAPASPGAQRAQAAGSDLDKIRDCGTSLRSCGANTCTCRATMTSQQRTAGGAHPAGTADGAGSIPFMITGAQKAELRKRGYTDQQIRDMTPTEAHRILTPAPRPARPPDAVEWMPDATWPEGGFWRDENWDSWIPPEGGQPGYWSSEAPQ
jgi:hypothetical protein